MLAKNKNPRFTYIRRLVVLPLMAIVLVLFAFRNKEQRVYATISIASVVENVVDGIAKKIPGVKKSEIITTVHEKDTNIIIKADKITMSSVGESVEIDGKVHFNLNKLNSALIVLDGKKTENTILETLNPNLIESINVLKGESATSLYGEEGKNGVVMITTKQYAASQRQSQNNNLQNNLTAAQSNLQAVQGNGTMNSMSLSGNKNNPKSPDTLILFKDKAGNKLNPQPLVLIDGVKGDINSISPDQIKRVDVLKSDSAILKYGEEGKNGVVLITSKNAQTPSNADTKISNASIIGYHDKENTEVNNFLKRNPLVKDVYWWAHTSFKMQIELKDGTEETYDLLNSESKKRAEGKYGKLPVPPSPPAPRLIRQGVKVEAVKHDKIEETNATEKVFAQVQTPAEFPGGEPAWLKYLQRNLNLDLPVDKGAPPGKYTVVVSFIVDKEGNISDVKAENDPGFGTKDEAIRMIVKGPKWIPAKLNEKKVIYRVKQNVTWLISEPDVSIKSDNAQKNETNKKTAVQKDYESKLEKAKANNLKTFFTINDKSCVLTDKGSWAEIAGTTNIVIVNGKRTSPEELNSKFKRTDFILVAASATEETIKKYGKGVLLVSSKPLTPKEVSSFLE